MALHSDDILQLAKEKHVRFVELQLIDILGTVKTISIPVEQLPKALNNEIAFDGSSIEGFVRIEESDMILYPDPQTFTVYPWMNGNSATARLICDVYNPNGTPFAGDPRGTLKRVVREAEAMGYSVYAGTEAEFFLFNQGPNGEPTTRTFDQGGYFDLAPIDRGEEARRDMVVTLQDMGFDVEASHHETAPGQHEIDFKYADAVSTADNIATLKFAVRLIARRHGLHATFMPKPIYGIAGSGMHIHQSLFKGDTNAFHDADAPCGLSNIALSYMAGILTHAKGMTAITNPLINSYKRLVPGHEAPCYIAWSERNRSPLIRIPSRRGQGTRIELRSPDTSCNPYLALAVSIKAGLEGIKRGLTAPEPINSNIYDLDSDQRHGMGIESLPGSLVDAIAELHKDTVIQEALGEHITRRFIHAKSVEWDEYRMQVHQWELDKYLMVF